jgi:hypothetical protein
MENQKDRLPHSIHMNSRQVRALNINWKMVRNFDSPTDFGSERDGKSQGQISSFNSREFTPSWS